MLKWAAKPCKENKLSLGSRIPVSQAKRTRPFGKMDEKKKPTRRESTSTVYERNGDVLGIAGSKFEHKGAIEQKWNIEAEVFDWLTKNTETSDKYTEYCLDTNLYSSDTENLPCTASTNKLKAEEILDLTKSEAAMAKCSNGPDTGTKSYFSAFKNAIFPFEGKYFYLSGELKNQNKGNSNNLMDRAKSNDDKYKEILGERKAENETKQTKCGGLKDTKVYHEDQRVNKEDKNGYVKYQFDMTPLKINLKTDNYSERQQKEINKLRAQIEELSTFVENSDERREQSEKQLAQQKEENLKHIREKEALDNRLCCLEELRRNLQRKLDEISEENMSLKLALKSSEERLSEEKERVSALKKECSVEIAKNTELELVLQTIREELGCTTSNNTSNICLATIKGCDKDWGDCDERRDRETGSNPTEKLGEKKVTWGCITIQSQEITSFSPPESPKFNTETQQLILRSSSPSTMVKVESDTTSQRAKPQYSCLKQQNNDDVMWKREKKQFQGKIMLLEMDKKKLRSQIETLEEEISKQQSLGQNFREHNEVLEFRILELEYELQERTKKEYV